MSKVSWPVLLVTLLLVVNTALASLGVVPNVVHAISSAGLLLVPWMVVRVLRDRSRPIRELGDDEWGYQDRPDLRPGR